MSGASSAPQTGPEAVSSPGPEIVFEDFRSFPSAFVGIVGMIAYHDVKKDRPGEGLPSRREAEDARLQGGGSGRNRHEHGRRRIPADDVHGQGGRKDALSLRPAAAPAGSGPAQRELARSEGDSQGDERRLPGGSDRAHERFVEGFRILDRDGPGRDPHENPEGREASKA